jgi:hypothetical protein
MLQVVEQFALGGAEGLRQLADGPRAARAQLFPEPCAKSLRAVCRALVVSVHAAFLARRLTR